MISKVRIYKNGKDRSTLVCKVDEVSGFILAFIFEPFKRGSFLKFVLKFYCIPLKYEACFKITYLLEFSLSTHHFHLIFIKLTTIDFKITIKIEPLYVRRHFPPSNTATYRDWGYVRAFRCRLRCARVSCKPTEVVLVLSTRRWYSHLCQTSSTHWFCCSAFFTMHSGLLTKVALHALLRSAAIIIVSRIFTGIYAIR